MEGIVEEAGWGDEGAPEWKEPECRRASSQPPHLPPIAPGTPQRDFPRPWGLLPRLQSSENQGALC